MRGRPTGLRFVTGVCALCVMSVAAFAGSAPAPDDPLGDKSVEALREMLRGAPEMTRYQVVKALGARTLKGGALQDDAVALLLGALGDAACVVRFKASEALAKAGPAVAPRLGRALSHSDRNVRASAARALRAMGPPAKGAVPALDRALRDKDYQVRRWAVDALGNIGPEARAALPALRRLLRDNERSVRDVVARALPKIDADGGDAVPALAQATGDPACDVREAVCVELARLGPKAAAAAPALRKRLGDDAWPVRKAAAEALLSVEQDSKEAVAAVAQAFAADKRPFMKGVFFRILVGRDVGPEAKPIAPYAVGQLKQKLADLRKATRDRHKRALGRDRDQLVRLLSRIGPAAKDAAPALGELLADKALDTESRKALEELLKTIGQ